MSLMFGDAFASTPPTPPEPTATTAAPTTAAPTTAPAPTTAAPTTIAPTVPAESTVAPTTLLPATSLRPRRPSLPSRPHPSCRLRRRPSCRSPDSTWSHCARRLRTSPPARGRSASRTAVGSRSRSPCKTSIRGFDRGTAPPGSVDVGCSGRWGSQHDRADRRWTDVVTADSTNLVCAVLDGNAQCGPAEGQTTVTWTVSSNDSSAIAHHGWSAGPVVHARDRGAVWNVVGTEVIDGQTADQEITETVTVQLGDGSISELNDRVVVAAL